jgi:hypothetical protein
MPFTHEQKRTLIDGGGLAVELPATREGHRRFATVGWHKLAMAGTPEFAAEPMTYVRLVYEIHESAMDTWVSNLDMRDRVSFQTESEEEIVQFAARYAPIDAYRKFLHVGAPR